MDIPIDDLRAGMVLGRNLEQSGRVLLSEGALLSTATIEILRRRGVARVDIQIDSGSMPPGSPVLQAQCANLHDNADYMRERSEIEALFASVKPDDTQLTVLKYCILRQLEEKYHDREPGR